VWTRVHSCLFAPIPAYALKNKALPVPKSKRLMAEGADADSMKPINPTVTWPNHTAQWLQG